MVGVMFTSQLDNFLRPDKLKPMKAEQMENFAREFTVRQIERKAFVETATKGNFMSKGEALILAEQKYPFPNIEDFAPKGEVDN